MNKKLKLALATLLGFSAACSTVKNAPAKGEGEQQQEADGLRGALGHPDTLLRRDRAGRRVGRREKGHAQSGHISGSVLRCMSRNIPYL